MAVLGGIFTQIAYTIMHFGKHIRSTAKEPYVKKNPRLQALIIASIISTVANTVHYDSVHQCRHCCCDDGHHHLHHRHRHRRRCSSSVHRYGYGGQERATNGGRRVTAHDVCCGARRPSTPRRQRRRVDHDSPVAAGHDGRCCDDHRHRCAGDGSTGGSRRMCAVTRTISLPIASWILVEIWRFGCVLCLRELILCFMAERVLCVLCGGCWRKRGKGHGVGYFRILFISGYYWFWWI